MNGKNSIVLLIILSISFMIIGCTQKSKVNINENEIPNKIDNERKLSLEDVKKKYNDKEIVNIVTYKHYVLVESSRDTYANSFHWYNLATGDMDILPVKPHYCKLEKIVHENHITFLADGTNHINHAKVFPFSIECRKDEDDEDFRAYYRDKYFKINEATEFGQKENEVISNVKVTLNGIEILFEPIKGKEGEFYAGNTTIPPTEISYNTEKHQLIVKFTNTRVSEDMMKLSTKNEDNYYLDSYQVRKENDSSIVILNLKDAAKFYTADIERMTDEDLPYLRISFSDHIDN